MAGNNSIRGDESILFTDNLSLDGTERGGKLTVNGQLWLGSSSSPHVRKSALTTDGSLSLTQSEPTSTTASLDVSINGPVNVDTGGTGRASHTAYAPIFGGTTTTSAQQSVALGSSGTVLTSNGAGVLPSFQASAGGGSGGTTFLSSATASDSASIDFTSSIDSTYNEYIFIIEDLTSATTNNAIRIRTSTDGGSTWDSGASDYAYGAARRNSIYSTFQSDDVDYIATTMQVKNGADDAGFGYIRLCNPSSSEYTFVYSSCFASNDSDISGFQSSSGARKTTSAVDAIQFYGSAANILAGTISMYGMTKPS